MATVTVGEYNEGDDRHVFVTNALGLPPLADGTQLQASVTDVGTTAKLVIIVIPTAPTEAPAPASA